MLAHIAAVCCLLLARAALAINVSDAAIIIAAQGACSLDPLHYFDRFYAAMNLQKTPDACGRCLWVRGAKGSPFIVRVEGGCPTCAQGQLHLSSQAFSAITGASSGLHTVAWEWAASCDERSSPPLSTPSTSLDTTSSSGSQAASFSRRLLGSASATKRALEHSEGEAGDLTDWVVACEDERARCPSAFLASWGYQCANEAGDSCCLQPNGKHCTRLPRWRDVDTPDSWMGRDLAGRQEGGKQEGGKQEGGNAGGKEEGDSASGGKQVEAGGKAAEEGRSSEGEQGEKEVEKEKDGKEEEGEGKRGGRKNRGKGKEEEEEEEEEAEGRAQGASIDAGKGDDRGDDKDSNEGSGRWNRASATVYWSYPDCCHDSSADQSECTDYSGCKWEGYFAGLRGKQPKSWVSSTNIAAFYEAPNQRNRQEWGRKWGGKKLRIRAPGSQKTMIVTIYDTCDDDDCDSCCTENASRHGGQLVDLEWHTARRFWGKDVPDVASIEWQLA